VKAANLLGEALSANSQLATLILDHNPLGAEGGTGTHSQKSSI